MKGSNPKNIIANIMNSILPPPGVFKLTSGYVLPNHKKRKNRRGTGKWRNPGTFSGNSKMTQRCQPESRRGANGTLRR